METTLEVVEPSQVAQLRRLVSDTASRLSFGARDLGRATLAATELGTNLVKYAKQGFVTVRGHEEGGSAAIDLVAADRGPGFADFARSARDGHSTGGTLGLGLGVIRRASDEFDFFTSEGRGSVFWARVSRDRIAPLEPGLRVAGLSMPKLGQEQCGDAWACMHSGRWQRLCVVDGLGHGPLAALASQQAVAIFRAAGPTDTPADILRRAHAALKNTRGVVMSVVAVDAAAGEAVHCGVGNIQGLVHLGGNSHHLISVDGVVGYNMRAARNQPLAWGPAAALVMATDGLSSRWNVTRYPGLLARHPLLLATVLHRDHARGTDDATVVAAMEKPA